jgi:hypothetical protein
MLKSSFNCAAVDWLIWAKLSKKQHGIYLRTGSLAIADE